MAICPKCNHKPLWKGIDKRRHCPRCGPKTGKR